MSKRSSNKKFVFAKLEKMRLLSESELRKILFKEIAENKKYIENVTSKSGSGRLFKHQSIPSSELKPSHNQSLSIQENYFPREGSLPSKTLFSQSKQSMDNAMKLTPSMGVKKPTKNYFSLTKENFQKKNCNKGARKTHRNSRSINRSYFLR